MVIVLKLAKDKGSIFLVHHWQLHKLWGFLLHLIPLWWARKQLSIDLSFLALESLLQFFQVQPGVAIILKIDVNGLRKIRIVLIVSWLDIKIYQSLCLSVELIIMVWSWQTDGFDYFFGVNSWSLRNLHRWNKLLSFPWFFIGFNTLLVEIDPLRESLKLVEKFRSILLLHYFTLLLIVQTRCVVLILDAPQLILIYIFILRLIEW